MIAKGMISQLWQETNNPLIVSDSAKPPIKQATKASA
jgi:hypothetical protein